jgi:hypothetical protein
MDFIKKSYGMFFCLYFLVLTAFPENAWAVQNHGAPEGLYVHQLAHVFYTAAMCYFFWAIRRSEFKSRGWYYFQVFAVFMALWNVVAFTGHALTPFIDSASFSSESGYLSTRMEGPFTGVKLWYYFTKLDHLFSVPSLFCLYLGMKAIYRSSCREEAV